MAISTIQAVTLRLRVRAGEKVIDVCEDMNITRPAAAQINTDRSHPAVVKVDLGDELYQKFYMQADKLGMTIEAYVLKLLHR